MSIEVRVNTSVSPYRTCINVPSEHILCKECSYIFELRFCVSALSVSPAYSVSLVLSFPLNLFLLRYSMSI